MTARRVGGLVLLVALAVGATTEPGRQVLTALAAAGRAAWAWLSVQLQRVDVGRAGTDRAGLAFLLGATAVTLVITAVAAFRAPITGRVLASAYLTGAVVGVLLYARGLA